MGAKDLNDLKRIIKSQIASQYSQALGFNNKKRNFRSN